MAAVEMIAHLYLIFFNYVFSVSFKDVLQCWNCFQTDLLYPIGTCGKKDHICSVSCGRHLGLEHLFFFFLPLPPKRRLCVDFKYGTNQAVLSQFLCLLMTLSRLNNLILKWTRFILQVENGSRINAQSFPLRLLSNHPEDALFLFLNQSTVQFWVVPWISVSGMRVVCITIMLFPHSQKHF